VNQAVGTLQRRRYTECLPLLAAFVIAENGFTDEQAGFVIYNLTDEMITTELKDWFTRWLSAQDINTATTEFTWEKAESSSATELSAPALAFFLVAPLLVCKILIGDRYGVANSIAIILSILLRLYLLWQLRQARDGATASPTDRDGNEQVNPMKDLCIIRSDGKMITVHVPAAVLGTFTRDCKLPIEAQAYAYGKTPYKLARRVAWSALGVHICVVRSSRKPTPCFSLFLGTWAFSPGFDVDLGGALNRVH
jgi:hypothetical protein